MHSGLYLAFHALFTVFLGIRVVRLRWHHKVSIGHGEQKELEVASRVFGNHSEYAPLFLILLVALDLRHAPVYLIHGLGIFFLLGRIAHAIGLSLKHGASPGRKLGMISTFLCLIIQAGFLLFDYFVR